MEYRDSTLHGGNMPFASRGIALGEKMGALTPREKATVAALSLAASVLTISMKLAAAGIIGSVSIAAQAIYSVVTFFVASGTALCLATSRETSDGEYPFGSRKVGNILTVIEACTVLAASVWIIVHAMKHTLSPDSLGNIQWGIATMLVSAVTSAMVHLVLLRIGREEDSVGLLATAAHNRTDIFSSLGVALTLAVAWAGQDAVAGIDLRWVDTVAAIVIAVLNIEAALDLALVSGRDLLGSGSARDEETRIRQLVACHRPEVRGVQHVRARRAGHFRFVDFRVIADPHMAGEDFRTLRKRVSQSVRDHFRRTRVEVHVARCERTCRGDCAKMCALPEEHRWNASFTGR